MQYVSPVFNKRKSKYKLNICDFIVLVAKGIRLPRQLASMTCLMNFRDGAIKKYN